MNERNYAVADEIRFRHVCVSKNIVRYRTLRSIRVNAFTTTTQYMHVIVHHNFRIRFEAVLFL